MYFFEKSETDKLLAQTDIGVSSFQRLLNQMPDSIPNALKIKNDGVREYNQELRDHEKFDLLWTGYVFRKNTSRPTSCSDWLQPKKIMPGDLPFYIEGLLYLEKDDKVVETKLRFHLATSCTTNITGSLNNIRPLAGIDYIEKSVSK